MMQLQQEYVQESRAESLPDAQAVRIVKEDLHKDGVCFGGWGVVEFDHKQDAEEALQRCTSPCALQ